MQKQTNDEKTRATLAKCWNGLTKAVINENHSSAGKFNILVDSALAVIIFAYIVVNAVSSAASSITHEICSIYYKAVPPSVASSYDTSIIKLIGIFAGFSLICLLFMYFTEKVNK